MSNEIEILTTKCENCTAEFETVDIFKFICDDCLAKIHNCPKCGSDDVVFDWQVNPELSQASKVYYWSIRCENCDHEITKDYDLNESQQVAQEIFKQWQEQTS